MAMFRNVSKKYAAGTTTPPERVRMIPTKEGERGATALPAPFAPQSSQAQGLAAAEVTCR